ncbi:hypothetical protein, partial [Porphyromonas loveana]|uniref:hypothetical protein n=1 Tax=Porphyromonas loveana TaxID=1884669 RepID=UPI0035A068CE
AQKFHSKESLDILPDSFFYCISDGNNTNKTTEKQLSLPIVARPIMSAFDYNKASFDMFIQFFFWAKRRE